MPLRRFKFPNVLSFYFQHLNMTYFNKHDHLISIKLAAGNLDYTGGHKCVTANTINLEHGRDHLQVDDVKTQLDEVIIVLM